MQDTQNKIQRLKEENQRLRRAVEELSILNDLALAIGGNLDSEKIMRSIISKSIRAVGAEQGDITLVAENEANPAQTLVRSMVSSRAQSPLHLNQNLLGWMQIHKKPLMINDPRTDERFRNVKWEESVRTVLCAPLMAKSKLIGILTIYNKKKGASGFTESDQRLLSIIAAQSAQVVENARLYEEEQEYKAMRKEMELASGIQKKMLPSSPPEINGYAIGGKNLTAKSVGGDYFDFIHLDEDKWVVCLGDISGKGITASLIMSNLQANLRGQVRHLDSPSEILKHANHQLYQNTSSEKFATLFLGILDSKTNTLNFSSGGHEYPYLVHRDGSFERLQENGLPLGMFEMSEYEEKNIELKPGDSMFVYSDGITECVNLAEEEFGEKRLEELLVSAGSDLYNPEKLIGKIYNACFEHAEKQQLFDDMTALVVARNPN